MEKIIYIGRGGPQRKPEEKVMGKSQKFIGFLSCVIFFVCFSISSGENGDNEALESPGYTIVVYSSGTDKTTDAEITLVEYNKILKMVKEHMAPPDKATLPEVYFLRSVSKALEDNKITKREYLVINKFYDKMLKDKVKKEIMKVLRGNNEQET